MANINGAVGNDIQNGDTDPLNLNDTLNFNWSTGDDIMVGGLGNDTYRINSSGDQALENAGAGWDSILSRASSFNMATNATQVESITLDNTPTQLVLLPGGGFGFVPAAVSAVGNALSNSMYGNDRDNTLSGGDGNDSIYGNNGNDTLNGDNGDDYLSGGDGNDTLNGGFGNDSLVGGTGNDTMAGSIGNDTYWVDSAGDVVTEGAFLGGTDRIVSTVNIFALAANVENLDLSGTAVWGYGNGLDNAINGTALNNVLSGLDGADTLSGYGGNDSMYGGTGNDVMNGGTGDDTLDGDAGTNTLTGGTGADRFVFDDRGAANRDVVTDFTAVDDTIVLANSLDLGLVGAVSPGILGLSFLGGNAAGNDLNAAWYFENQVFNLSGIYYYDGSGEVWYNPTNGLNGDEVVIGRLGTNLSASLTNADFEYGL